MRLWQKVFLTTLALVTLAVNLISFIILQNNHRSLLNLAKENASQAYSSIASDIKQTLASIKSDRAVHLLVQNQVMALLPELVDSLQTEVAKIQVDPLDGNFYSVSQIKEEEKSFETVFFSEESNSYIQTSSFIFIEGQPYRLSVQYDISQVVASINSDITYVQYVGSIMSIIVAGVLLFVIQLLMKRLKNINVVTTAIAEGAYHKRLAISGHDELAELAENMNLMTSQIEKNIGQFEAVAENRKVFIANMTHEIKTPLTSIVGFADILKIKPEITEDERREYASIIGAEANRLKVLSTRLMELISINNVPLQLERVRIDNIIHDVMKSLSPIFELRQLTLRGNFKPLELMMDKALFTSLLYNILDNAIKASESGESININVKEQESHAIITIEDHGVGIPEAQVRHVTEAFYMMDVSRTKKEGGAGIGLSLSKAIVEAHHGKIHIKSREGLGTCVALVFPIAHKKGDAE